MTEQMIPYEDPPLDEETVGKSLMPIESVIPIPIDVDRSIKEWNDYQRLCREILDDKDYAEIRGIKARKRSGWAKLRRFYNISTRILEEVRVPPLSEWEADQDFMYKFTIAGWLGGRVEHGDGACEVADLRCPHCHGDGCDRCKGTGFSIAPTEHNVRAKALTRAKNRVTSDLIGGGEVSAEELNDVMPAKAKKHWIEYREASKKFWVWAHESLGLTDDEVRQALDVKSVKDYPGSMKEAKKAIEEWLAAQMEDPELAED